MCGAIPIRLWGTVALISKALKERSEIFLKFLHLHVYYALIHLRLINVFKEYNTVSKICA